MKDRSKPLKVRKSIVKPLRDGRRNKWMDELAAKAFEMNPYGALERWGTTAARLGTDRSNLHKAMKIRKRELVDPDAKALAERIRKSQERDLPEQREKKLEDALKGVQDLLDREQSKNSG